MMMSIVAKTIVLNQSIFWYQIDVRRVPNGDGYRTRIPYLGTEEGSDGLSQNEGLVYEIAKGALVVEMEGWNGRDQRSVSTEIKD